MKVPNFVAVTISIAPRLFRSVANTSEPEHTAILLARYQYLQQRLTNISARGVPQLLDALFSDGNVFMPTIHLSPAPSTMVM
jgi:hypothetical protein